MREKTFKDVDQISEKDISQIYSQVKADIIPILGNQDTSLLGSAFKKLKNDKYGDIDIGVHTENEPHKEDLERVKPLLEEKGFETKIHYGLSELSLKVPFKNNFVQVDLMFGDLEWLKFSYHSPDFTKQESKYKGLYRTMLIQSAISEINKDVEMIDGVVSGYEHYTMRLGGGLYKVKKSLIGKKGNIIKTPKIIDENFISCDPDFVSQKFFGVNSHALNSFENVMRIIKSPEFYYNHFKDQILTRFEERLIRDKYEFPYDYSLSISKRTRNYMFVGGFKPITGAHYHMITSLLYQCKAIIFIGKAQRDGITQDDSFEIANKLFGEYSHIEIIKCKLNPVVEMFRWLEDSNRELGKYTLVSGSKDNDYDKSAEFFKNYSNGGKYRHNLPPQVEVFECPKWNVFTYRDGKRKGFPISSTNARQDVINNDFEEFQTNYPLRLKKEVKEIYDILKEKIWVEQQVI